MNTPIRYDWYDEDMRPAPYGLWVEWTDYMTLKDENARLREFYDNAVATAENDKRLNASHIELLQNQIAYLDKKLDEELDKGVQS